MIEVIELAAILVCTVICIHPIRRILHGPSNILHFCAVSFWGVQVVPLIMKLAFGVDKSLAGFPKMYAAMHDEATCMAYLLFVVIVQAYLDFLSRTLPSTYKNLQPLKNQMAGLGKNKIVKRSLFFGMFFELPIVVVAPDPSIYFEFSYFYTHTVASQSPERLYHYSAISFGNIIAFFCSILYYYFNNNRKQKKYVYLAIAFMTWVNGKRTLMTMALLAILVIDFVRAKGHKNRINLVKKGTLFLSIIVCFFLLYSNFTGKFSSTTFNYQYSIYFGRMSNVETCIYSELKGERLLDYRGQSILYDLLFWIPRSLWDSKPVLYSKYFTAYVMGYNTIDINWQFQTNIWSEYISNFSFLGPFIAGLVLYAIAYFSEHSKSTIVYILGMAFVVIYNMYGFESLAQTIGIVWFCSLALSRIKIKI